MVKKNGCVGISMVCAFKQGLHAVRLPHMLAPGTSGSPVLGNKDHLIRNIGADAPIQERWFPASSVDEKRCWVDGCRTPSFGIPACVVLKRSAGGGTSEGHLGADRQNYITRKQKTIFFCSFCKKILPQGSARSSPQACTNTK
jgi:hypothetical protein